MIGKSIAHYRVTEMLGKGGMEEVYRTTDTKLGREVALKVLPPVFANDAQRMARFKREAHVLASLNHPNIASIYGLEEADGIHCLVLELVEGPTLAEKIKEGAVPLDESLNIATQIAEALEAAHEKGVIHRDLKPANVKVTPEGMVKVLDFGLAKALAEPASEAVTENSPTASILPTQEGVILGTAAYMSPEQAKGRAVDKRADIWAFGVVLFEMLTGKRLYTGGNASETLAAVIKDDPDWNLLPTDTHLKIRELLRRCLQKESRKRLHDIADARIEIEETQTGQAEEEMTPPTAAATYSRRRLAVAGVLGAVLLAAVFLIGLRFGQPGTETEVPWRTFTIPEDREVYSPSISPDGRHIAYITGTGVERELWVQDLNQVRPRKLIDRNSYYLSLFWSPDSKYVVFLEANELKKVLAVGGPSLTLCTIHALLLGGASWSPDGQSIVFSSGPPWRFYEVPAVGGSPDLLFEPTEADGNFALAYPHFLPTDSGGRSLLYVRATSLTEGQIVVRDLETGRTEAVTAGVWPVYSATGHVVFVAEGDLWAVSFSPENLRTSGEPFPLRQGADFPSIARDGTLVYVETGAGGLEQLVWKSRTGERLEPIGQPQPRIATHLLSPDGTRVVVWGNENNNADIWIHDIARGLKSRLTSHPAPEDRPIWSPDGQRVAFASNRNGTFDCFHQGGGWNGGGGATLGDPSPRLHCGLVSGRGVPDLRPRPRRFCELGNRIFATRRLWDRRRSGSVSRHTVQRERH